MMLVVVALCRRFLIITLLSLAALVLLTQSAIGYGHDIDEDSYEVAKSLNCPTCAGRNLADCGTTTCYQWKQEIKAQLEQGKTATEVVAYFKARFGPTVLQEPPKEGGLLVLWWLPVIGFGLLVLLAVLVARRASAQRQALAAAPPLAASGAGDDYVEQMERQAHDAF